MNICLPAMYHHPDPMHGHDRLIWSSQFRGMAQLLTPLNTSLNIYIMELAVPVAPPSRRSLRPVRLAPSDARATTDIKEMPTRERLRYQRDADLRDHGRFKLGYRLHSAQCTVTTQESHTQPLVSHKSWMHWSMMEHGENWNNEK